MAARNGGSPFSKPMGLPYSLRRISLGTSQDSFAAENSQRHKESNPVPLPHTGPFSLVGRGTVVGSVWEDEKRVDALKRGVRGWAENVLGRDTCGFESGFNGCAKEYRLPLGALDESDDHGWRVTRWSSWEGNGGMGQ